MGTSSNIKRKRSKDNECTKSNSIFKNLKSNYFLEKIYDNIQTKKKLEIVKYNKNI